MLLLAGIPFHVLLFAEDYCPFPLPPLRSIRDCITLQGLAFSDRILQIAMVEREIFGSIFV